MVLKDKVAIVTGGAGGIGRGSYKSSLQGRRQSSYNRHK